MVIVGLVLLLLALLVVHLHWLLVLGVILIVIGLVLNFVPVGGTRRTYY